jgi:choline dehydrogenase-like flavoprotein
MTAKSELRDYDYVICGGGSAGCVLANRLSADPRNRVALVEAGSIDNWIWFHIPVGYLFAIGNPRADWLYRTEAEAGLNGRSLAYPRGRVLGGSSAINAMIYMRGQAADYDRWRDDLGLDGWGWNDVLPLFKRQEDSWRGAGMWHGAGGEWRVEQPRVRWRVLDTFITAAEQAGIPRSSDFNTGTNLGCGYFDVNQRRGRRWSAARGFLDPIRNRPNLTILTGTLIDRIEFDAGAARRVIARRNGEEIALGARAEVILAAGAIGTPAILERSGIGSAERLRALGIDVVHDAPGVGANLQDHLQLRLIYRIDGLPTLNERYRSIPWRGLMGLQYALLRRGALTMAPSQLGAFVASSKAHRRPNLQFHIQPLSLDRFGEPLHPFPAITVSVCNLRPSSRGAVHVASPDPLAPPRIEPNYLSTEEDRGVAVEAIGWARRIMSQPAFAPYGISEQLPGAGVVGDEQLAMAAGDIGTTIFHPVGTARMGTASEAGAVTDARLRVRGVSRLRIADASVMPAITSGNTNSPTMMIAEKASEMLLADR